MRELCLAGEGIKNPLGERIDLLKPCQNFPTSYLHLMISL